MRRRLLSSCFAFCLLTSLASSQSIAVLHYAGGGDWYSNPTALPGLIDFCNTNIGTTLAPEPEVVTASDPRLFTFPLIHMTGHGNVFFSEQDKGYLREYLSSGGFIHIDDNYGMDPYIRPILQSIFAEAPLLTLPITHPIFHQTFEFPQGLPKIHEHDNAAPQALGIHIDGRLVLLYTFESDLGDGWEHPQVHNDPLEIRLQALQMGANIIQYVFLN